MKLNENCFFFSPPLSFLLFAPPSPWVRDQSRNYTWIQWVYNVSKDKNIRSLHKMQWDAKLVNLHNSQKSTTHVKYKKYCINYLHYPLELYTICWNYDLPEILCEFHWSNMTIYVNTDLDDMAHCVFLTARLFSCVSDVIWLPVF